jgi:hypothetical protein
MKTARSRLSGWSLPYWGVMHHVVLALAGELLSPTPAERKLV